VPKYTVLCQRCQCELNRENPSIRVKVFRNQPTLSAYVAFGYELKEKDPQNYTFALQGQEWGKLNEEEKARYKIIAQEYSSGVREIPNKKVSEIKIYEGCEGGGEKVIRN
jgi:hypothetical protein